MISNADAFDMQCVDTTHVDGCPCHAGGDPVYRCWLCGRDTSDGLYRNVDTKRDGIVRCCDICWEKRDEDVEIPLDYTRDEVA